MPSIRKSFDPRIGPVITFGIAKPHPSAKPRPSPLHQDAVGVNALVDTGATRTCVTAIARKAGLRVMGKTPISSVHGTEDANVYVADILLFVDLREGESGVVPLQGCFATSVSLVEFVTNSPYFNALLGRDELCLCDFRMTKKHEFILSH